MKKRFLSILLMLALFLTLLPTVTLPGAADTVVGYHSTDGQTWTSYTNTTSLINTIQKQNGTHYVRMEADWNLKSTISDRITINSSANVTIYMQGHVIDRGLTGQASYGNVFLVEAGASLVLDGGTEAEQETRHLDGSSQPTVKGYNVNTSSPGTLTTLTGTKEIRGAVLTGAYTKQDGGIFGAGASYYGGAIQMLGEGTSVRLINVTVVGNRTNFGGGAINVDNTGNTVTLENSRLIYNYAGEHGGGIRMNGAQFDSILNAYTCTLKMTNSAISNNYAGRNGGGIETDAVLTLKGDGNSSISDNICAGYNNGSNYGGGGGIDVYKGAASISGVIIDNNRTNSYQGGGVLIEGSADSEIKNCTITNNQATGSYGKGGGVFLKYGGSTISDCTITGNSATSGSGVYLDSTDTDATVNLGGMLHITGNTTSNLYLSAGTYISPGQNGSSAIGVTAAGLNGDRQLSKDAGTYPTAPYVYDGGGYGFQWCNDPTDARYRYLYIVSSGSDAMPAEQALALDYAEEISGRYNSGAYKLIKAAYSTSSAADSLNENDAVCFYSDGYFFDDPTAYNAHLASMSMALVTAGFTTNWGGLNTQYYTGTAPDAPLTAVRYNNKHAHIRQLLANLGFADADFYASEMELSEPMMDTIGVAISHKALKTADDTDAGKILVPVVVRSNGYEDEWASNFTLGSGGETAEGESLGFAMAANMVYSELLEYIDNYGLTEAAQQGDLIFWVVGYSRGGATANLVARRLLDGASPTIDVSTILSDTNAGAALSSYVTGSSMAGRAFAIGDNQVVSYTFEAPQGGTDAAQTFLTTDPETYFTLHNVISAIDPVPYVAMTAFGFKRYGVDHYVPGQDALTTSAEENAYTFAYAGHTHTVAVKTITAGGRTVTTYRDNDYLVVPVDLTANSAENTAYLTRRTELLRQYQLLNPYMTYDDYFEFAEINYSSAVFGSGFNPTVTCSMSREDYTAYLIQKLVDWKASSRTVYTSPFVLNSKTHSSYQGAIRDVFKTIYGLTPQQTEAFSDALRTTMGGAGLFGSNVGLFGSAINVTDIGTIINTLQNYGGLNESEKEQDLEDLWSKLVKLGLLDALPADAVARLQEDWYTLGDLLLTMLYQDRNDSDVATRMGDNRRVLGTALYNYSRMFLNHYSETVMAWLRTDDAYYANENVHYVVTRPASVAQPAGEAVNANGIASAVPADAAATEVVGTSATLYLDVENIGGEAIYYTVGAGEQTYNGRDGIALSGSVGDTVTVNAYAMSYGVKSPVGAYRIQFITCPHASTTLTGAVAATCTAAGYSGDSVCDTCGETVTAGAALPALGHDYTCTDDGNGTTHTVSCSRCDYNATENHAFVGGVCVCGAAEVVETLRLVSASPVLNDKIDMIYAAEVPASYTDPYIVFTFNGTTTTVTEYTTDAEGRLCFVFADINPQCIGDDITATLYATKNGAQESVSVTDYSVRDYCVNKLAGGTIPASLRALLSDLLAYGAAAQTYMGYKTDDLITSGEINDPTYSTFSVLSGNAASFEGTAAPDLCWTSASLTLTSSVAMSFRFYAESTANLSVTVSVNGRSDTFTSFSSVGGGIYEVSFTGIEADEFAENVTARFARSGAAAGNALTYSVNAYVQAKQNDGSAALQALVRALYNYGASAAAFAAASNA